MTSNCKILDFIVVGAAKSGTTSLFEYIRKHPRVYIPLAKELPFFNRDDRFACGWESFAQEYYAKASTDLLWGKVTPQYMIDPSTPKRIHSLMPDVRLIAVLRNPIERAYSHYRMDRMRDSRVGSFEQEIERELQSNADPVIDHPILGRGKYAQILQWYFDSFPGEQILIHFAEDLESKPDQVLDSVFSHIGVGTGFRPNDLGKKYYSSGSGQRFPGLVTMARKISPVKWIWNRFSKAQKDAIRFWYKAQWNVSKKEKTIAMNLQTRKQLVEFYRSDVLKLEKMIGQKVPWKEFFAK